MQAAIKGLLLATVATFLVAATATQAPANPYVLGLKCASAKLKAAGKDCMCRHKALAKAAAKSIAADFGKCEPKITKDFNKADAKGQGWCRTEGDSQAVDQRIDSFCSTVNTALVPAGDLSKGARKCASKKIKAAGKLCMCLHKGLSKATIKGLTPDYAKCQSKYAATFAKTEAKSACATNGDTTTVEALIDDGFAEVEADLIDLGTDDFATRGGYGVGHLSLELVDDTRTTQASGSLPELPSRTLPTQIWYPADAPVYVDQREDAALVDEAKIYPLIVRSHGFGGTNIDSMDLTRHLASHGYIVVAPTFPLSNLYTPGNARTLLDIDEQARDVSFLIDTVLGWNNDPNHLFYGRVDSSRIGATGHSLGGATSLLAGFHSEVSDNRIEAVVALAPLACTFDEAMYDSASTPLLIMGGTEDMITPVTGNAVIPYQRANPIKYLMLFEEGTHMGFINRLYSDPDANGDEELFCAPQFPPGSQRPSTVGITIPDDYLGGAATGIDTTASICEPICPLPPDSHMNHDVQQELVQAGTLAFFDYILDSDVPARRLLQSRLVAENESVSMSYEEAE